MSRVWGLSTIPIGRDACSLLLNALSKFLDGQYRHGRGKRGVPRVEAAVQRLGALVAVRVQFLGDVGGRDVVRAAAIDDDVAVLGQRGDRRDRLAAVEQQRARYRRLQQLRRHAARVDQYRIETLVYQLLQLLHRDAVDLHRLMETLALDIFERHEQQQHAEHDQRRGAHGAEDVEHLVDAGVEEGADADADAAPQQSAEDAETEEAAVAGAHGAGQRWRDGVEAGDELGHDQRFRPPAVEVVFGLADAIIGRQRNAAQQLEDALAVISPGAEPEIIADQAGDHADDEHRQPAGVAVDRQRAGHDQQRERGDGQADLLDQYDGEHDQHAVLL